MAEPQPCYTLVSDPDELDVPTEQDFKKIFGARCCARSRPAHNVAEHGKLPEKIDAIKKVILLTLQGEKFPTLLMVRRARASPPLTQAFRRSSAL